MEIVLPPDLLPLRLSHEADAVEADLKQMVIDLFTSDIRELERELNVYGMAHLGPFSLVQRNVSGDGLALYRKSDVEAMGYLFRAWRGRNGKRGLHFLRTYLQLLWPNAWTAEQMWQPKNKDYPLGAVPRSQIKDADPHENYYLTSRVYVSIAEESETGQTAVQVIPALRSVLAARFVLILQILKLFECVGDHGLKLGSGAVTMNCLRLQGDGVQPAGQGSNLIYEFYGNSLTPVVGGGTQTFTRTSAGSRYNSAGLIESIAANQPRFDFDGANAKTNLLQYSESFTPVWSTSGHTTIAASAVTSPAFQASAAILLKEDGTTNAHTISQQLTKNACAIQYTGSIYVKQGVGSRNLRLQIDDGANTNKCNVVINPSTGAIVTAAAAAGTFSGASASVVASGVYGWYRVSITGTTDAASTAIRFIVRIASGTTDSYAGDSTSGFYIWGAQLEEGSSASSYIKTTTAAVTVAALKGLLMEGQRTNLLLSSGLIDTSAFNWVKGSNTTRIGTTTAPDGSSNAIIYSGNGSGSNEFASGGMNLAASTTYTVSVWAKLISGAVPTGGNIISAGYHDGSINTRANLAFSGNLTTKWKRFSVTFTNVNAGSQAVFLVADQNNTAQIAVWGAQCEAGSFASSYIPTDASSQATRADDYFAVSLADMPNYEQSVLTVYGEGYGAPAASLPSAGIFFELDDGTFNNRHGMEAQAASLIPRAFTVNNNVTQASLTAGAFANGAFCKFAYSVAANSGYFSANGSAPGTDTSITMPPLLNRLCIGHGNGGNLFFGHVRKLRIYNAAKGSAVQSMTA